MTHVDKLRQAYQAWHDTRGKSQATWLNLLHDDVTIRSLADGAPGMEFTAAGRGKPDVERYLAGLDADWEMLFYRVDEYVADGDRVTIVGRTAWRHKKTGKEADSPVFGYWKFRDGKAVEFFEFYDTAKIFAATQPG